MPPPLRRPTNPFAQTLSAATTDADLARLIRQLYESLALLLAEGKRRGFDVKVPYIQPGDTRFDPAENVVITKQEKL